MQEFGKYFYYLYLIAIVIELYMSKRSWKNIFNLHTCELVASKMLEKFTGDLAKKRENFVGLRYVKNVGK